MDEYAAYLYPCHLYLVFEVSTFLMLFQPVLHWFVGHSHLLPNFYYAVFATATGLIAFLVLIVMYIWIVIIAWKHILKKEAKIMRNSVDKIDSNESYRNGRNSTIVYKNRQLQMVKLFVFIVTANTLLWLPLFFLAIFGGILGSHRIPTVVYSIGYFTSLWHCDSPSYSDKLWTQNGSCNSLVKVEHTLCKDKITTSL